MIWIKFSDDRQKVDGLFGVLRKHRINWTTYIGDIHRIPDEAVALLDDAGISVGHVSESEVKEAVFRAYEMALKREPKR